MLAMKVSTIRTTALPAAPISATRSPIANGWVGSNVGFSPTGITNRNDNDPIDYQRYVLGARGDLPFLKRLAVGCSTAVLAFGRRLLLRHHLGRCDHALCVPLGPVRRHNDRLSRRALRRHQLVFPAVHGRPVHVRGIGLPVRQCDRQYDLRADLVRGLRKRRPVRPAGAVGAVIGALYQEDSIDDQPAQAIQDGQAWDDSQAGRTRGEDTTSAIYGELGVPLLKDVPFADKLQFTLSGRYTDVDSYGSESTYKAGLNWQIVPQFRVRASQGTSFRSRHCSNSTSPAKQASLASALSIHA